MAEKMINTRVRNKHDTEANWLKATNFTPLAGELIVYDPDDTYDYPRFKFGDGATNVNSLPFAGNDNKTYFVKGTQTAATGSWTGTLSEVSAPYDGLTIRYYLPYAGSGSASLALNGGTAYPIYRYGTSTRITTHFGAGSVITMTFYGNKWLVDAFYYSDNYIGAVCSTAAGTAAKAASTNYFTLANNRYFVLRLTYANSYAGAITLNVASTEAKPIYINGSPSSSSNYTLPRGLYLVYYDGTNYHFRTDGKMAGNLAGNADTATTATNATKLNGQAASYYATASALSTTKTNVSNLTATVDGKANASHTHSATDIASGTLSSDRLPTVPASKGGTGQTSLNASANSLINSLGTGSSTPTDADYYVSQYAGGGTTTTTYHRRPLSALWSWIKGKADSIYAAKSHGTHVTYATTAPKANGTASAGSAATVARTDHVHPLQTTVSGNAGTATKWATARTITLAGDASGSVSIDGSANKTLTVTVADDSHDHVISNIDGLQSALDGKAAKSHTHSEYAASATAAKLDKDNNFTSTENAFTDKITVNDHWGSGYYTQYGQGYIENEPGGATSRLYFPDYAYNETIATQEYVEQRLAALEARIAALE